MRWTDALQKVWVTEDEEEQAREEQSVQVVTALAVLRERLGGAADAALDDDEAAAGYALVVQMREDCESYERDLIRHLKFDQGRTWAEIATVLDGQLGSRQAAQKKWARLTDTARRVSSGNYRRGAAFRRPESVVDTTTPADE